MTISPPRPEIVMILARADNGVIGNQGGIPWHLSADLQRFKALTMGAPMIMGRKTFESFGKPLPGRRHIVLTQDAQWQAAGADVAHNVDDAMDLAGDVARIWIVGGAQIYRLFEPLAHRIELTQVHIEARGDTVVEAFDDNAWQEVERTFHDGPPSYSFITLIRREAG